MAQLHFRVLDYIQLDARNQVIKQLSGALIVSCQASAGEPLCHPSHIKALAQSAIMGGARALRLEGAENIVAVRPVTELPIIGLSKSALVPERERLRSEEHT